MSDEIVVLGGVGGTHARLEDLSLACDILTGVAERLYEARLRMGVARWVVESTQATPDTTHTRDVALDRLWWVTHGTGGLGAVAEEAEAVGRNLAEVVLLMERAEAHSGSLMDGLGRTWDKAWALGKAAVWLPLKATGLAVSSTATFADAVTPDIWGLDRLLAGVGVVGDVINPDWSPNLTPLFYGDDLQQLLQIANTLWAVDTLLERSVYRALGFQPPESLTTLLAAEVALVTLALDEIFGDPHGMSVVPVRSRVVPPPTGVEDLLARTDRLSPTGPDGPSRIAIEQVSHDDGTTSWIVELPGTQDWFPDGDRNPINVTAAAQLMAGQDSALTIAVQEAMLQAGIPPGDPVMLVGHSLGGIAAMSLVSRTDFASRYNIRAVVTADAPVASFGPPPTTSVLSLEHPSDMVPALDGADNPDRPHWITVRRDLGASTDPADRIANNDMCERHYLPAYGRTAATVDQSADPSIRAWREAHEQFFDSGATATRTVFEVTQGSRRILLPGEPGFTETLMSAA